MINIKSTTKGMIVRDVRFYPLLILGLVVAFAMAWLLRKDAYPLTIVAMFSGRATDSSVGYTLLFERYADGSSLAAQPQRDLGVFKYMRHRPALFTCFTESRVRCEALLEALAQAAQANGRNVSAYVIERWRWDFRTEPCCGQLETSLEFPVSDLIP
jgi:hypothetical protein